MLLGRIASRSFYVIRGTFEVETLIVRNGVPAKVRVEIFAIISPFTPSGAMLKFVPACPWVTIGTRYSIKRFPTVPISVEFANNIFFFLVFLVYCAIFLVWGYPLCFPPGVGGSGTQRLLCR